MKKYLLFTFTAIIVFCSCSKENLTSDKGGSGKNPNTFTAWIEESNITRATYDATNENAAWEIGDTICINGKIYLTLNAGSTTALNPTGQDATGSTFNAYFACGYDGETASLPLHITDTWVGGKFNMPMYATCTSPSCDLYFKNICGVLKITVTDTSLKDVKSIRVCSANKATSGTFSVDNSNTAILTSPDDATDNEVTVYFKEAVVTDAAGKAFYVAVPAQTYQELTILVSDSDGLIKSMTTKTGTDISISRTTIYPVTFVGEEISNTGTKGYAYANGVGIVKWIQLWKDGPKFAEYNVGVTDGKVENIGLKFKWADNIATSEWGSKWCMPTRAHFNSLISNCTNSITTINGVIGLLCKGSGTGYENNSVFLPATKQDTYYWSSDQYYGNPYAFYFYTHNGNKGVSNVSSSYDFPVRAIVK